MIAKDADLAGASERQHSQRERSICLNANYVYLGVSKKNIG